MQLTAFDIIVFLVFFGIVIGVSMFKSRRESTSEDYFLAGRSLFWPFIGLSLIAANISTEHFVGMAGQGAGMAGLAIASYEWIAAITLVVVALFFLPKFIKSGIYTIPEYLEYRFSSGARGLMAFYTMLIYVFVTISAVLYSGGLTLQSLFGDLTNKNHLILGIVVIGGISCLYTVWGGLKAVAWADLFLGSALLIGGAITMILGFREIGVDSFFTHNADKLHMILPADHPVLPWTVLLVGLWIPNFYYWGLNQYIAQRTLGAKTLRHGQLGVLFAAGLKLIIPFIIIFPGIMAYQLYGDQMKAGSTDAAYPLLIKNLIGPGTRAFIFAAISGAVISSLASMLNSASTIFTMDIYKRYLKVDAAQRKMVSVGRLATVVFVAIGCVIAPFLSHPSLKGIFTFMQEFQGFLSPGVLAVFLFGLFVKRAPRVCGVTALVLSPILYTILLVFFGSLPVFSAVTIVEMAFLNRMAITFLVIIAVLTIQTVRRPLPEPVVMPSRDEVDTKLTPSVVMLGIGVVAATLVLYAIFW